MLTDKRPSPTSANIVLDKLNKGYEIRPFPRVVQQLLTILKNPNVQRDEIARVVESDAALASRVLRMVNSPVFGVANIINSIEQAIVLLGAGRLKNLAQTYAAAAMFATNDATSKIRQQLWNHSLACATAARLIAKQLKTIDADDAFLAGIFHDVGQLFFLDVVSAEYSQLLSRHSGIELVRLEREQYEISHQELGVKLATAWQLPEPIMVAVGFHHEPGLAIAHQALTTTVHLANGLVRFAGIGSPETPTFDIEPGIWESLKLSADEVTEIRDQTRNEFIAVQQAYGN